MRRARASTAAFLAAALGTLAPAWAIDFGTLFHTPEERARLDRARRGEPASAAVAVSATPELTGFVKRSDGRNTVWINGVPTPTASPKAEPLLDPRKVRDDLRLPADAVRATPPSATR